MMGDILLFCLAFALCNVFFWKATESGKILAPVIPWIQTYAPAWIPRAVLGDCRMCSSFWWLTSWQAFLIFHQTESGTGQYWGLLALLIIPVLTDKLYSL